MSSEHLSESRTPRGSRSPWRLASAFLSLLGASGCSSDTCGTAACVPPITIDASIANSSAGPLHVTLCMGSNCESVDFDPWEDATAKDTTGYFDLRVGASSLSDAGGVGLVVFVLRASDLSDGEVLHLTVKDTSGATVLDWSAPANYKRAPTNGGCDTCTAMQVSTSS